MSSVNIYEIQSIINDIYNNAMGIIDRTEYIQSKYPKFMNEYPVVCKMVCMPRFNIEKFNNLIAKITTDKEKVCKKRKFDTYEESNAQIIDSIYAMYLEQCNKKEYFV
jgi:hypothetical protein